MNEYAGCQVTNDVEIGADDIEPSLTAFLEIDKEEISGGEAGKNRIWNGLAEVGNQADIVSPLATRGRWKGTIQVISGIVPPSAPSISATCSTHMVEIPLPKELVGPSRRFSNFSAEPPYF